MLPKSISCGTPKEGKKKKEKGVNKVGYFPTLKTELQPASEMSDLIKNQTMDKVKKKRENLISVNHIGSSYCMHHLIHL
jgi:hypothetical protein